MKVYTFLQEKELAAAEAHGLSRREIRILKDVRLDHVQMRLLRAALEKGISLKKVKKAARHTYTPEEMEKILLAPEMKKKRKKLRIRKPVLIGSGLAVLLFASAWAVRSGMFRREFFLLRANQITLVSGDVFQPSQYVLSVPSGDELILPESFSARRAEERIAVYRTSAGEERVLRIRVLDREEPRLSIDSAVSGRQACTYEGVSAWDEADGDLSRMVTCEADDAFLIYRVSDRSGNQAAEKIKIIVDNAVIGEGAEA